MKVKLILVFYLMILKNLFSGETPAEKRKGTPFQKEERTVEIEQYKQQIEEQKK